jgi:hypothetical protein
VLRLRKAVEFWKEQAGLATAEARAAADLRDIADRRGGTPGPEDSLPGVASIGGASGILSAEPSGASVLRWRLAGGSAAGAGAGGGPDASSGGSVAASGAGASLGGASEAEGSRTRIVPEASEQ